MGFDLIKGRQGGRDWSCGIGDEDTETSGENTPWGALAGGAVAIAAVGAGVLVASSLGGGARRPATAGPPTVIMEPTGGHSTSGRYVYRVGRR